jgi:hypothetical protein
MWAGAKDGYVRYSAKPASSSPTLIEMEAVKSRSSEEDRERLLEAGWESRLQGGLIVWRRPEGRGSWYSQEVAIGILEAIEEQEHRDDEV